METKNIVLKPINGFFYQELPFNLDNANKSMQNTHNEYIVKYNNYDAEILKTDLNKSDENHKKKI